MEKDILPQQFLHWYENERPGEGEQAAVILDVREHAEWDYYHLEEAWLMPMQSVPAGINRIPRDKTVYVVCAHGVRSAAVCDYLESHGYDNTVNVIGGMAAIGALRGFRYD